MKNRDVTINTFEGGLDMDTDRRLVANNKLVVSENIDITKRGDSFVVTDIDGEEVLFRFQDTNTNLAYILAATNVNFLIEPTDQTRQAILVFYVTDDNKFIIKALYLDNGSTEVILQEDLTNEEKEFLKDSSVDLDVVGKFGYDVVYFTDNRRQPRKIDCVKYITNANTMTLTLNSEINEDGYKRINLNLTSSSLPADAHRCYVYAYKTGGPINYIPLNPLTETVKFLNVNYSGSSIIGFNIYSEDYGDYTFQIVYHREGADFYRNFIIGNPFKVDLSVGSFNNFIVGIRSPQDQSSSTQVPSWEFLYGGNSFVGYINTPTVVPGVTMVYLSETEDPQSLVPDGYYQRADLPNSFFRVQNGVITEQEINNGDVVWSAIPSEIESDIRLIAQNITEGNKDRLTNVNINVPQSIVVGGITYTFLNTTANSSPGREKASISSDFTYTIEYPEDLTVVSNYSPQEVLLEAFVVRVIREGDGYNVTGKAFLSSPVSQDLDISMNITAIDPVSQNMLIPVQVDFTIPAQNNTGEGTVYHDVNLGGDVEYGPACILNYFYLGPEQITPVNQC